MPAIWHHAATAPPIFTGAATIPFIATPVTRLPHTMPQHAGHMPGALPARRPPAPRAWPPGLHAGTDLMPLATRGECRRVFGGTSVAPPGSNRGAETAARRVSGLVPAAPAGSRMPDGHKGPERCRLCRRHPPAYIRRGPVFPMLKIPKLCNLGG